MAESGWRGKVPQLALLVVALGVFVYAGSAIWRTARAPSGSERRTVTLVCLQCGAESEVPAADLVQMVMDPQTGGVPCPKCGASAARVSSMRCHNCGRAIPPQPMGSPFVCPFCKVSLSLDDEEPPPSD